ncbi:putative Zn-dependent hydrolase of the beta-lactamase fold [Sulfitobacter noctilucicola]|uniref:L-ascorbate metabolism protein UlaG (Beta-lactamase superfamily) n=1 Tax=Sulfitobacter noctilucicola TaxID=1342301 RepID=A0A7W6M928_9RHOB|nr:MBL fold metallo-hydrolase [Sulfitobacter noctilucicola]KIN63849.1 putative Zn-dependent hydrolase of the beta-lactamase fold [Sulfitobacter noctilucicola]MBB4174644.1 L-ascorbate metabolism protein UlaG (beta-lactamase superfamily) [Sulfitobacter noctilucicola]
MMFRLILILLLSFAGTANAQERTPSHCIALANSNPDFHYVTRANLPDVTEETVLLHYIAHASFLIRSHGGLNIVTDFTGFTGTLPFTPDVVTMNHAHDSHWTAFPDPAIPHPLEGWGPFGEGIEHRLDLGEVLIRNVSTDIRSQFSAIEENGNSIFVFEMAGLCIGHLGHLHHAPDDAQHAALGRLDVVMAPVDGGYTLDQPTMISVLKRLKSSIVIPMHWFSDFALDDFLTGMSDEFTIVRTGGPSLVVSLDRLPSRPTIMVLRPSYLNVTR